MDIKKLDKVFSDYIRQRDADENGLVKCCTCDTVEHWKQMDAGHYYKRGNKSVRWDERNCHAQCIICNRLNNGEDNKYWTFMLDRYGFIEFRNLLTLARSEVHWMQHEIDEMTEKCKIKIKEL